MKVLGVTVRHPGGVPDGVTHRRNVRQYVDIIVNDQGDGADRGESGDELSLDQWPRSSVTCWSHPEFPAGQSMLGQPTLGIDAAHFRAAGDVDDVVTCRRQFFDECITLRQKRIKGSRCEELFPIVGFRGHVVKSMTDVREDAVDIEDRYGLHS